MNNWHIWRYLHRQARFFTYRWRLYRAAAHWLATLRGQVLDVGAGNQPFRPLLSSDVQYVAVDVSPTRGLTVVGSALALPFAGKTFDGVICTEVLEHVPEPAQALREMYRILKPGGLLYVTVPMTWGLHYEPHDYYRFTRYGITYLAHQAGFQVTSVIQLGGLFTAFLARCEDILGALVFKACLPVRLVWGPHARVLAASWLLLPVVIPLDLLASFLDRLIPWARQDALGWVLVAERPVTQPDPGEHKPTLDTPPIGARGDNDMSASGGQVLGASS